jgi:hypothetical protein
LLDFDLRFHLRAFSMSGGRAAVSVIFAALAFLAALALAPGCRRDPRDLSIKKDEPRTERIIAALALLPADTRIVLSADLERLRGQPAWRTGFPALAKHARPFFDAFAAGAGFDVPRQLRSLLIALPGERQSDDRFVLIAETDALDEARVTAWLRARLGEKTTVLVRNKNQIVIGRGAWGKTMAGAGSAADNPELKRLCTRAALEHDLWFAGVVPTPVRRALMQAPGFADVASVARVWGFMNLDSGAHLEAVAEMSGKTDAVDLAHRLGVYLNQAKRHPDMLVRGLAPFLEALRLAANDASVHATLDLSGPQLGECIERIEALAHASGTK